MTAPDEQAYERALAELRALVEEAGDTLVSARRTGDVIELVYYDKPDDDGWRVLFSLRDDGTLQRLGRNRYRF
jgi:hypothetical protein